MSKGRWQGRDQRIRKIDLGKKESERTKREREADERQQEQGRNADKNAEAEGL